MKSSSLERAKRASKEGIALVSKRIKVIKLFNKSEFRWQVTVNEYLSDKLASNSDDEKKMSRAERIRRIKISVVGSNKPLLLQNQRVTVKHFGMILQSFCV